MDNQQASLDGDLAVRLVQQAPDVVIFIDRDGVIRVWNEAAERVFGFTAEQALGQSVDIIIPERLRAAHWRGFDRAIANGTVQHVGRALPTRSMRADGTKIYVELSFAIVLGPDGSSLGSIAHGRDITERFEREKREKAERAAAAADK